MLCDKCRQKYLENYIGSGENTNEGLVLEMRARVKYELEHSPWLHCHHDEEDKCQ